MAAKKGIRKPAVPRGYQPTDPSTIPGGEKRNVTKLLERIERAKKKAKDFHEISLKRFRGYQNGTRHQEVGTSNETQTRTNLIYATQATLLPHIYAKNPDIAVSPTEAVQDDQYEQVKKFAKTAQVFLGRTLVKEARLKERAKSNIRSAMNTSVGWWKLTLQESLTGDALIINRHNDLQDNLRRIEHLARERQNAELDSEELDAKRDEIREQIETIEAQAEVRFYKGYALDRVQTEDILILDESITDFYSYVDASDIAHRVWMTDDDYCAAFGAKPATTAKSYGQPAVEGEDDGTQNRDGKAGAAGYRAVWEVHSKKRGMIYTVCEGAPGYCREPYAPTKRPQRWYPFFCLAFNVVEGRWRPIADTELLMKLQDEYNTTRYYYAEARKEAVPVRVYRKSGELTDDDIENLKNRKARQWIGIDGNPNVPLDQDIMQLDGVKIQPEDFDVTVIRNDMDMLVGLSDASRANLIEAKTATEAEIMRQALMTRVAERQDANEDLISEVAEAALEIGLQAFSQDEIVQICGEGAEWMDINATPLEEIFQLIDVSVRAGSTGKPNANKEREQWTQVMPIVKETAMQVSELRAAGQFDMANTLVELLKETLQRFDEKIDIDRFIPRAEMVPGPPGPDGAPGPMIPAPMQNAMAQLPALQQENEQLKLQLQEAMQKIQELESGEQARVADAQSKTAIASAQASAKQAEEATKAEEVKAKAAVEAAAAQEREQQAGETERAKIAAEQVRHERDTKAKRDAELLKLSVSVVEKVMMEGQGPDLAKMKETLQTVLDAVTKVFETLAGDTVPEYNGDDLVGMMREPLAAGAATPERLMELIAMLANPQETQYDDAGRITRVTRRPAVVN